MTAKAVFKTALNISNLEKIKKILADEKPEVNVGIPEGKNDPESGVSLARIAAVHEFGGTIKHPGGTPYKVVGGRAIFLTKGDPSATDVTSPHEIKIPERSFIRSALKENRAKYVELNKKNIIRVIQEQITLRQALGMLGEVAVGDVKRKIGNGPFEPLKPATIKAKGSSKPLIDTGRTRQSVAWEYADAKRK